MTLSPVNVDANPGRLGEAGRSEPGRPGGVNPRVPRQVWIAWASAAAALVFLKAAPLTFIDPDLFHQLSLAREIVETGAVPREDVFSYTPTIHPHVQHEWGAGILWLGVLRVVGGSGFLFVKYGLLALLAALSWDGARRRGADALTFALLAIPAVIAAHYGFTTIRAQLLTLLALAALLGVLGREPPRPGPLMAWLVVHVLWVNVHAGFVVGLGFMGLETLERALRREPFVPLALATATAMALVLVNPWGFDYVVYLARALTMSRAGVSEWAPLYANPQARWLDLALWLLMAGLAAYAVHVRGPRACRGLSAVAVAFVFAMQHQRHITLLGVTWLAVVSPWLAATPLFERIRALVASRARSMTVLGAAAATLWTGAALLYAPFSPRLPTDADAFLEGHPAFPVGAADYLVAQRFRGRLMTPFVEGGYAMWRLHPQGVLISWDGRYEVAYPPEVSEAHLAFFGGAPGWQEVLRTYPTDVVLVPRHVAVVDAIAAAPGWRVVYADDLYLLVARDGVALPFVDRRGQRLSGAFP
jgi:hypothetical protein